MLDTLVLMLPRSDFKLRFPERFTPNAAILVRNPTMRGMSKAVYNPTTAESRAGYKPRLTLLRRPGSDVELKVEFSAPKVVFGNNFEVLSETAELKPLLAKLKQALDAMGIVTTVPKLRRARVSTIHYSKNVLLERHTPAWMLIRAIERLDVNGKLDLAHTTFRNSGLAAKFHASSYEVSVYDKVKDLEHARVYGAKRGMETDYDGNLDLFGAHRSAPEVLRFEVRLTTRKLKSLLPRLGIDATRTLEGLFRPDLARAVLLHFWRQLTDGLFAEHVSDDVEETIERIRIVFPDKSGSKVSELAGFAIACRTMGPRGARLALGLKPHQYYRLKRDLKRLSEGSASPTYSVLTAVKAELIDFLPLTADDLAAARRAA
jgi:hypothetical protein